MQLNALGLLFDMDGTLVNSGSVVENEWRRFALKYALPAAEVIELSRGMQNADVIKHYLGDSTVAIRETQNMDWNELYILDGIAAMPGARELVGWLPATSWALVTSASRPLARARMRAAGLPLPDVMVCAEDVPGGSLAPDGYLQAAKQLRLTPKDCVVFEDALAGVQAGLACGAQVVHVGSSDHEAHKCHSVRQLNAVTVRRRRDTFHLTLPRMKVCGLY